MRRARPARISLLLADVDGTLVTHDKVLTERARAAVHRLHEQGIRFAITSGRPPRGMVMLTDPLRIDTAIAAFNGGIFVEPDLTVIDFPRTAAKGLGDSCQARCRARARRLGLSGQRVVRAQP